MKDVLGVLAVILIAVVGWYLLSQQWDREKGQINQWAQQHHCEVVEIGRPGLFELPFWFADEDDSVYKVKMRDHLENEKTCYFKFSTWGMEVKE